MVSNKVYLILLNLSILSVEIMYTLCILAFLFCAGLVSNRLDKSKRERAIKSFRVMSYGAYALCLLDILSLIPTIIELQAVGGPSKGDVDDKIIKILTEEL